ncbi:MAG: superfamily I DNA/RNA helicase, partial [Comamonadaceae bacterium]
MVDGSLDLCVDQRIADGLHQQQHIGTASVEDAIAWLTEEFIVRRADGVQRVFAPVYARRDERKWRLHGRRCVVDMARAGNGAIWVDRVAARRHVPLDAVARIEGHIRFADATAVPAGDIGINGTLLDSATTSYGTYLDLWRLYSEKEWKKDVMRAIRLDALPYRGCSQVSEEGGGWRFDVEPQKLHAFARRWREFAGEGEQLEVDDGAPDWQGTR